MKPYVFIGFFVFLLAVVGKHFLLNPPQVASTALAEIRLPLQQPCDLQQTACIASDGSGRSIRFSLAPTPIPLMQELTASATTVGLADVRSARLTVEGVNMFMGYQYADLNPSSDGVWQGKLVLPVCSLEAMQWKASLRFEMATHGVNAEFPFTTSR